MKVNAKLVIWFAVGIAIPAVLVALALVMVLGNDTHFYAILLAIPLSGIVVAAWCAKKCATVPARWLVSLIILFWILGAALSVVGLLNRLSNLELYNVRFGPLGRLFAPRKVIELMLFSYGAAMFFSIAGLFTSNRRPFAILAAIAALPIATLVVGILIGLMALGAANFGW